MAYHALRPLTLHGKTYRYDELVDVTGLPSRKVAALVRVGYLVDMPDAHPPVPVAVAAAVEEPEVSAGAVCEICGSEFKNEMGLNIHMSRKHEEPTEEEPEDG